MLRLVSTGAGIDPALAAKIAQEHAISPLTAQALLARGLRGREEIAAFLRPSMEQLHDPLLLPDMPAAVERIRRAIAQGERCCVYGDYDVDGVCATAILYEYLCEEGADVCWHLPARHSEGYGMHADAVRGLHERGVRLIITVDNGVSAQEEIALCHALGMDVVVTDHHQCPPTLPACCAVVNPAREDSAYPFARLCGAGIALKLVEALGGRARACKGLDLAALATVADVVPLLDENRTIVALGMKGIRKRPGLGALLEVAGAVDKPVDSETLAFRLAPRLNAAGRMGDAGRALKLLLAQDGAQAMRAALELNDENTRRQQEERRILLEARARMEGYDLLHNRAVLLYGEGWNPGVTGIVASRLVEEYHRPVILFHAEGGLLTGSGRSIPGVHLYDCLHACAAHTLKYGGHAQAAGLTVEQSAFPAFFEAMQAYLAAHIPPEAFTPSARFELETPLSALSSEVARQLELLEPFGEGNPRPVFCTRGVGLQSVQRIGKEGAHLRAQAVQGAWRVPLVAFGRGEQAQRLAGAEERFDILYTLQVDSYREARRLELLLHAARHSSFFGQERYLARGRGKFYDAFYKNFLYNVGWNAQGDVCACEDLPQRLVAALREGPAGTLILCCTPDGADRLRALLVAQELTQALDVRFDDGTPCEPGAYNLALLAPDARCALQYAARYEQIFLFDCAPDCPQAAWLAQARRPVLAAVQDTQARSMLHALPAQREPMLRYYRSFQAALRQAGGVCGRWPLCRRIDTGAPPEAAMLALLVFVELGFFTWDAEKDCIALVQSPQARPLAHSGVYAFMENGTEPAE